MADRVGLPKLARQIDRESVRVMVRESRAAQGLAPHVTDAVVLARVAAVFECRKTILQSSDDRAA